MLLVCNVSPRLSYVSAELGLAVCARGPKRLSGSPCGGLCSRAGEDIPCGTREDATVRVPEPTEPGRRKEGTAQVIPEPFHSGMVRLR